MKVGAIDITSSEKLSFLGRNWRSAQQDEDVVRKLQAMRQPEHIAKILVSRGVGPENLDDFLEPRIKKAMPDPFVLKDMERGAKRFAEALWAGEKIGLWSDYDVDGETSAAIMGSFLEMCGHENYVIRIPDRIKEGYGPNIPGLLSMKNDQDCNLVAILDAGIVAFDPLDAADQAGMEIVVIDHHIPKDHLPKAVAVINPNRRDDTSGLGYLCAAGVCFMFVAAVMRELKETGFFDGREGRPGEVPNIFALLDLVALGTVGDVVPLIGLNRAYVRSGLIVMNKHERIGMRALIQAANNGEIKDVGERDCGWTLGPRINAAGRIRDSILGVQLLLCKDAAEAAERAQELNVINDERKAIGQKVTDAVIEQMSHRIPGVDRTLVMAVVDAAHEGVVGISAGRAKEQFSAPSIVVTHDHEGNLKGSARSVAGFDIGHAIIEAAEAGIILKGGGHGMAGGLTLAPEQVEKFTSFMNEKIEASEYFATGYATVIDLETAISRINVDFIESLEALRPYGTSNTEPMILIRGARVERIDYMKEVHMRIRLQQGRSWINAPIFNVVGTPFGDKIADTVGRDVDAIGKVQLNHYNGKTYCQFMLDDMRLA